MELKYVSAERLEELKKELENFKRKRQEIAQRLEEAKALGDLSENTEYMQAREAQAFNEGKIIDLEETIKSAVVIDKSANKKNVVQVGATVSLLMDNSREVNYTIVGSSESNPTEGKISNSSPLGQALLGKKKNEEVNVQTPQKKIKYKILSID